ncbi:MAG: OmpH family outer membrane protein [Salinisphaera sp.]|nr:OmpH family outer membrane protein [Salinisphaera sp.]
MAQPSAGVAQKPTEAPRIGVVDLTRLVNESPQAQQAKDHMAKRFAKRKTALEQAAHTLQVKMDRLKDNADKMSDAQRDKLSSDVRDSQHDLALKQSRYNDDVSDAETEELKQLRADLRSEINAYAKAHDYDVILGDSVLYANPKLDITDQVLARLSKRP